MERVDRKSVAKADELVNKKGISVTDAAKIMGKDRRQIYRYLEYAKRV
jgi:hypothetical protein